MRTEVDMMEEKRAMTVRLDADQAEDLEALASVEGSAIADEIRKAIDMHIENKKKDKAFQSRLRESLRRNEAILKRLADR